MNIYELSEKDNDLRKERLNKVIKIKKIDYNERGTGDIYRVFDLNKTIYKL